MKEPTINEKVDFTVSAVLETSKGFSSLLKLLIDKGVITEEEFRKAYDDFSQEIIREVEEFKKSEQAKGGVVIER